MGAGGTGPAQAAGGGRSELVLVLQPAGDGRERVGRHALHSPWLGAFWRDAAASDHGIRTCPDAARDRGRRTRRSYGRTFGTRAMYRES